MLIQMLDTERMWILEVNTIMNVYIKNERINNNCSDPSNSRVAKILRTVKKLAKRMFSLVYNINKCISARICLRRETLHPQPQPLFLLPTVLHIPYYICIIQTHQSYLSFILPHYQPNVIGTRSTRPPAQFSSALRRYSVTLRAHTWPYANSELRSRYCNVHEGVRFHIRSLPTAGEK